MREIKFRGKSKKDGELLMITSIMSRILRPQIFNFREKQEIKLINALM